MNNLPEKWYCIVTEENKHMCQIYKDMFCSDFYKGSILNIGNAILSKYWGDESVYVTDYKLISNDYRLNKEYKRVSIIEINKEIMDKTINSKAPDFRELSPVNAQKIILKACDKWKQTLADKWAIDIVLNNSIKISEEEYKIMRTACTTEQHILFDEIFGKDELPVDYTRIKTGSKVIINHTDQHCYGIENIDITQPCIVLFFDKEYGFHHVKSFFKSTASIYRYTTLIQNGNTVLFSNSLPMEFIESVIEY